MVMKATRRWNLPPWKTSTKAEATIRLRQALQQNTLNIGERDDEYGIFAKLSEGNTTVHQLVLYHYEDYCHDHETLRAVGKCFGNLEALGIFTIRVRRQKGEVRAEALALYWQQFARALGGIQLSFTYKEVGFWTSASKNGFVEAIRGASTIQTFRAGYFINWKTTEAVLSGLATLPALKSLTLGHQLPLILRSVEGFLRRPKIQHH